MISAGLLFLTGPRFSIGAAIFNTFHLGVYCPFFAGLGFAPGFEKDRPLFFFFFFCRASIHLCLVVSPGVPRIPVAWTPVFPRGPRSLFFSGLPPLLDDRWFHPAVRSPVCAFGNAEARPPALAHPCGESLELGHFRVSLCYDCQSCPFPVGAKVPIPVARVPVTVSPVSLTSTAGF